MAGLYSSGYTNGGPALSRENLRWRCLPAALGLVVMLRPELCYAKWEEYGRHTKILIDCVG